MKITTFSPILTGLAIEILIPLFFILIASVLRSGDLGIALLLLSLLLSRFAAFLTMGNYCCLYDIDNENLIWKPLAVLLGGWSLFILNFIIWVKAAQSTED